MANHRWWTTKMGDLLCQLLEGTTITNDPSKWWIFHGIFHVYEVPGSFSIWFVLFASLGMDQLTQVWLKMGYHQWPWISFDPRFLPMNLGPHICISQQQTPLKLCRIYPMKYASILMAGMFRVSCLELFFLTSHRWWLKDLEIGGVIQWPLAYEFMFVHSESDGEPWDFEVAYGGWASEIRITSWKRW